jgi:hypothetical protein
MVNPNYINLFNGKLVALKLTRSCIRLILILKLAGLEKYGGFQRFIIGL